MEYQYCKQTNTCIFMLSFSLLFQAGKHAVLVFLIILFAKLTHKYTVSCIWAFCLAPFHSVSFYLLGRITPSIANNKELKQADWGIIIWASCPRLPSLCPAIHYAAVTFCYPTAAAFNNRSVFHIQHIIVCKTGVCDGSSGLCGDGSKCLGS
jgi:hypothetical protein